MIKRILNTGVFKVLASVFMLIATTEVSTASIWLYYQPKAPKSLEK